MSVEFYLDPNQDAPIPDGWETVESEVDLLRWLVGPKAGVIRGRELCRWAEDYARGRGITVRKLQSPSSRLLQLCPELSQAQAQELAGSLGNRLPSEQELELLQLAKLLWNEVWWGDEPGPDHAAKWLLWWLEHAPSEAERVVLACLGNWYKTTYLGQERSAYEVNSADKSFALLKRWLGMGQPLSWGDFPTELSANLIQRLQDELKSLVIKEPDELLGILRGGRANKHLLSVVAEVSASYYLEHPERLTLEVVTAIEPHVNGAIREKLRKCLPPKVPGPLPEKILEIGSWFVREYLPYRIRATNDPEHLAVTSQIGRQFAEWYLQMYKDEALFDGPARQNLSWVKASQLKKPEVVTLMVVLDGLGYVDMQHLWEEIRRFDVGQRITLLQAEVAFAPLPTITECAKPALLKGVKPALAKDQPDLGRVLVRDRDVKEALAQAKLGNLIIWSDLEPDSTYHRASGKDVALRNARGILTGFAERLTELLLALPKEIPLRVVVTTDHGRLLAEAPRIHPLPEGAQSRQRAALGNLKLRDSIEIEGDLAYLHRDAFGLSQDCVVVLSGESFLTQDGKRGVDAYPHGGIYPEEVLIPWWEFARDYELKDIEAELLGKGVVERAGQIVLQVRNPNPISVVVLELSFGAKQQQTFPIQREVSAMGGLEHALEIPSWPSKRDVQSLRAQVSFLRPDQRPAYVEAKVRLEVEEMYQQGDNPLEDLL
ncbi:hypothetical protein [Calidithermus timidus]|jgi:hypothetical protein|uniref:hypothetical protein n=1 Tax=Calidithermus timidus TaxID=307124 RepID=UPI0012F6758D|nr:hypothetical protein [Calidithermus timidus]